MHVTHKGDKVKLNIGILTFHTPINYGAILQAYALQAFLKNRFPNADVKTIDFRTDHHISKYRIYPGFRRNLFKYFFELIATWLRSGAMKKRKELFKTFLEQHIVLTKRYATEESFLKDIPGMDVFIVGSDQVFHPRSPYLRTYYLDFQKKDCCKIAYAPSFGISNFTREQETNLFSYLMNFDFLSCREKDGAEFMSKLTGKNIPVVLDPVFLLPAQEWSKIMVMPKQKGNYIFVYDLNGGNELISIALKIKKATGYPVICQTQKADSFYPVDQLRFDTGPAEFLGYIHNAAYVVTDSFHGVAFSVHFQKEFVTYIARPGASTRVRSLLGNLGLSDRIVDFGKNRSFDPEKIESIEYRDRLLDFIFQSENYLLTSINSQVPA